MEAIETKSGNMPWDIVVTGNLDLVYVDYNNKTVNMVKNAHDIEIITKGFLSGNLAVSVVLPLVDSWLSLKAMMIKKEKLFATMIA